MAKQSTERKRKVPMVKLDDMQKIKQRQRGCDDAFI